MDRDAFLARVRSRLAAGAPENLPHPMPDYAAPELRFRRDLSDPVATFAERAEAALATVRRAGPREVLTELLGAHEVGRAVLSQDPETDGVRELLGEAGVEVVDPSDLDAVASCDLGVTGAAWGLAATGSLVVDAARARSRSASLVPPVHLAFLQADRILPQSGDLFRRMGARFGDRLPSQLVLVTGPSRSADIELTLTMGVHGPKAVWIGILDG